MWVLLYITLLAIQTAPQPGSVPKGGEIHGRVTDADTGLPVARVRVLLGRRGANDGGGTTITDDDGRYRFGNLPAGTYSGLVDGSYSHGIYRLTSLFSGTGPSASLLELKEGERREVNVSLARAFAIAVRVVDEWGEPLSGLRVEATPLRGGGSRPQSWLHQTDDRGRMRIFGLEAGQYTVCVPIEGPAASGPPAQGSRRESLLTTCYPSGTEAEAEPVRVERSDVGELEIRMRRGRTFTLSGRVLDASGVPAPNAFVSVSKYGPGRSSSWSVRIGEDSTFTATNVPPGEYVVEATVGGAERPEHRRPYEAGFLPLRVSADADGLVVRMQKGVSVPGRLLFDDPAAEPKAPAGSAGFLVSTRLVQGGASIHSNSRGGIIGPNRTFTLERMYGQRAVRLYNAPRGWYVKSIQYDGKEVIDEPVEFKDVTNPPTLDILLSNRGATVTGRVIDDAGKPASRALVLAFRANALRGEGAVMNVTASADGTFQLGPTRAGTYLLVALPRGSAMVQEDETERVAKVMAAAERVTLGEMEERTADLRLVVER